MGVLAREFWREPGKEADEIMGDEHLAVAGCAGADADGGDLQRGADSRGDVSFHEFEDDGECARFFNRKRVGGEGVGGLGCFAFELVAAFFADALREHAEVGHDGDAVCDDVGDTRGVACAAFEFHGVRAGGDEAAGVGDGLVGRVVAGEGEVGDDKRALRAAGDGGGVMEHVLHGDVGGVGEAEDDHAEGIADEEDVDAAFVEQPRGRVVVGGEDGELFAAAFHGGAVGGRHGSESFGEEFDAGGIVEALEEFGDGVVLAGEEQVGTDVRERSENEAAEMQARVGDDDLGVAEDEIAGVEDVEIEGARGVARAFRRAPEIGFGALETVEQRDGLAVEFDFEDGVQICARVGPGADGFGFIDA